MDISTASRIIAKVTLAIGRLYPQFVKMPLQNNLLQTQTNFYHKASFPRVIGCVDGSHVRIQSPGKSLNFASSLHSVYYLFFVVGGEDPEIFRNRKGYFSINMQAVCDSDLRLLDVVARWPGSTHDSTIFNNSRLRRRFETNEFPNSILLGKYTFTYFIFQILVKMDFFTIVLKGNKVSLVIFFSGDSGYMLRNYLLTPLANPVLRSEQLYNESHIRTRNTIERCFGVWKRRFPVLAYGLRLKLNTILQAIVATAVLYNLAKNMNEEEPPLPEGMAEEEINYLIAIGDVEVPNIQENYNINHVRNQLITEYFSAL